MTELRAKHSNPEGKYFGIDGNSGKIADMKLGNIWDPINVKLQTYKTSIESSCMLLRIDDIVSGIKKKKEQPKQPVAQEQGGAPEQETFGDARDG